MKAEEFFEQEHDNLYKDYTGYEMIQFAEAYAKHVLGDLFDDIRSSVHGHSAEHENLTKELCLKEIVDKIKHLKQK